MKECKHFNRKQIRPDPDDVEVCIIMKCSDCEKILYNNRHIWNLTLHSVSILQQIFETTSFETYNKKLELICNICSIRAETTLNINKSILKKRNDS